mmetsp:Transcript_7020/g.17695  ORF Transcript_7020/g.17695 Transcript_7020/m.17695 type:complete len:298 (+) Transcript_7020:94-987(+)
MMQCRPLLALLFLGGAARGLVQPSPLPPPSPWARPQHGSCMVPPGSLGPPNALRDLPVGAIMPGARQDAEGTKVEFEVERLAMTPPAFLLRGFLSRHESEYIMGSARARGELPKAQTTSGSEGARTRCRVAWLGHDAVLGPLATSVGKLLLTPESMAAPGVGVEDLQVLHYQKGGEFVLHHDGAPRSMTIIYYLNGCGGTWLPLADREGRGDTDRRSMVLNNKAEALEAANGLVPGRDGVLVGGAREGAREVQPGDALVFYSYKDNGSGQIDWQALHAGLPSEGEKWIAVSLTDTGV